MTRLLPLLLFFFSSCDPFDARTGASQLTGYVPVYAPRETVNVITTETARATIHPGKIYAYGGYLFQIEQNEGIHIIDNHTPKQAKKIAFLKVPMASELAIKLGHLYTNNMNDLVVFDLSTITAPKLVSRVKGAFPVIDQEYPPVSGTYFECPDPSKGVVIGWVEQNLDNPKCRR